MKRFAYLLAVATGTFLFGCCSTYADDQTSNRMCGPWTQKSDGNYYQICIDGNTTICRKYDGKNPTNNGQIIESLVVVLSNCNQMP
jgi:hypothetical protein